MTRNAQPRAAVDVGTNSVRLLVVDPSGQRLVRRMTITRLGAGVDRTRRLDNAALDRTLATVSSYRHEWMELGVRDHVRIAATSAIRDAVDRDRFFDGVQELSGVLPEVLSGDEEARLSFVGATSAIDVPHPVVVLDVGGGSTEIVVGGKDGAVAGTVSLQLGCVRLSERFLASDPPTDREVAAAAADVQERLDHADQALASQSAAMDAGHALLGVAGTVTTIAALHLGLPDYDEDRIHGTFVPSDRWGDWTRRLIGMRTVDRAELGPVVPGREDVIAAGGLVVHGFLERYGFPGIVASEADVLDGLAATA